MKTQITLAALLSFALSAGAAYAGDTLVDQGQVDGRTYHQKMYDKQNCKTCHGVKAPTSYPADDACVKCHKVDKLAAKTERQGDEKLQNPHDNLHYGKDVPCVECHGEHTSKEPLCSDCHTFDYPKFKK
ncbi:cytochrome c3 family protein [Paraferrimonas sedimenticola]|uniref:Tetrahaem cytochrome domain-containing protein n=1 Tax=Paraferrimonas sedimenticola TaxID=375674 RepID=A0AA37RTP6_9GAMM|nr:cytochrome c3 family protein [Paraferrimonas sedimenticola]GLP95461.1 hypothetical protein GCM10007895_07670 [Paraferrimonas sedimenticola]